MVFCDDRKSRFAVKNSLTNPKKNELKIEIPNFNSGQWTNLESATILSETTIKITKGTKAIDAARVTIRMDNYPNLTYQYFVNSCKAPDSNEYPTGVLCYIDMHNVHSPEYDGPLYELNADLGTEEEYVIQGMPYSMSDFVIFLQNLGEEDYIFSLPEIYLRTYEYEAMDYTVDDKGKVTVNIKANDEFQLSSMFLENPFSFPRYMRVKTGLAKLPIIANATHTIGIDIEDSRFYAPWDYAIENEAHFFMNLSAREDFYITFYVIEVRTTCYLDALEKWHEKFSHIYHYQHYGTGNWLPFDFLETNNELDTTYLATFFWGSVIKYKHYPRFRYVEPTLYHIRDIHVGSTLQETIDKITECANDPTHPDRDLCYLALRYTPRGADGNFITIRNEDETWNTGIRGYLRMEGEALEYKYNSTLNDANSDPDYDGIGQDSFACEELAYQAGGDDPFPYMPMLLVDKNQKRFMPLTAGLFHVMVEAAKNLSGIGKDHFLANNDRMFPQYVKFLDAVGYECHIYSNWGGYIANNFHLHRYTMGSRALSMLEDILGGQAFTRTEKYFSICASLGIFPSYYSDDPSRVAFWKNEEDLLTKKSDYLRWGPILRQATNHTIYRANCLGRLNYTYNTTPSDISYYTTMSMFCEPGDEKCYLFAMIAGKGTMNITINEDAQLEKSEVIFRANNLEATANGREIQLKLSDVEDDDAYRTACIELTFTAKSGEDEQNNPGGNGLSGGEIAGIVIVVILGIAIIAIIIYIFVFLPKKKENESTSPNETQVI